MTERQQCKLSMYAGITGLRNTCCKANGARDIISKKNNGSGACLVPKESIAGLDRVDL